MLNEFWVEEYLNNKKRHLRAIIIKINLPYSSSFSEISCTVGFNFTVKEQE
jgi:hypothetical protein